MIECPCCKQSVSAPPLDVVVARYKLTPMEERILSAVWRGKGRPVPTSRIFDKMFEDDPDGGPSQTKMYLAFKVSLCHLRKKLEGSGISVVNAGYGQGYQLVIGS